MAVVYAEIVGTRMAEEGSGGFTVNSTSYSVLVFDSNGTVRLVEGNANQIQYLLPYMRSRGDYNQLWPILDQFKASFMDGVERVIQQTADKLLLEIRNPLPQGITGKSKEEAKSILEEAGFKVEFSPIAPDKTPGIVLECNRKTSELMTAVLKIKYTMPDTYGLNMNIAKQKMETAGFIPTIKRQINNSVEHNSVFMVGREGNGLNVILWVNDDPYDAEENDIVERIKNINTVEELRKEWKATILVDRYPEITKSIDQQWTLYRSYGVTDNIEILKQEIIKVLHK